MVNHLLFGVIGLLMLADKEALAWMRGKKSILEQATLRNFHLFVWLGLLLLIASGAYLFWPRWDYLLWQPLFIIKLLLVGVLLINGVLIGRLQEVAVHKPFAQVPRALKMQLFLSGAISFLGWLAAGAIAVYLFS